MPSRSSTRAGSSVTIDFTGPKQEAFASLLAEDAQRSRAKRHV